MNLALFRGAVNRAAKEFEVGADEITLARQFSSTRVCRARAAVIFTLLEAGESINQISKYLGYSDHTGAMLLKSRYERLSKTDPLFRDKLERVKAA